MFADRLKETRKDQGYTQATLAQALGVSNGTVAMWETGKRTPDFSMLCQISDLLDRRVDYLLGHSDDVSSPKSSEKDIENLAKLELEDQYRDIIKMYLTLDEYGKAAVENLIRQEKLRCHDQNTIMDVSNIKVMLQVK